MINFIIDYDRSRRIRKLEHSSSFSPFAIENNSRFVAITSQFGSEPQWNWESLQCECWRALRQFWIILHFGGSWWIQYGCRGNGTWTPSCWRSRERPSHNTWVWDHCSQWVRQFSWLRSGLCQRLCWGD